MISLKKKIVLAILSLILVFSSLMAFGKTSADNDSLLSIYKCYHDDGIDECGGWAANEVNTNSDLSECTFTVALNGSVISNTLNDGGDNPFANEQFVWKITKVGENAPSYSKYISYDVNNGIRQYDLSLSDVLATQQNFTFENDQTYILEATCGTYSTSIKLIQTDVEIYVVQSQDYISKGEKVTLRAGYKDSNSDAVQFFTPEQITNRNITFRWCSFTYS